MQKIDLVLHSCVPNTTPPNVAHNAFKFLIALTPSLTVHLKLVKDATWRLVAPLVVRNSDVATSRQMALLHVLTSQTFTEVNAR